MAGVQDSFRTVGNEAVAFGTAAATLTRAIGQVHGQEPTPNVEQRKTRGMFPSSVAVLDSRMVAIARNGKVPVEVDLLNKSHGILLASVASDLAVATPGGGTLSRLHTFTPTTTGPTRSTTVHDEIIDIDGDRTTINYLGAIAETLTLDIKPKANVSLHVDFDYKSEDYAASTVTPSWPSTPYPYKDTDATVTLGGTDNCVRGLTLNISTGVKTDMDRVCPDGRRKPATVGQIVCTGSVSVDYDSTDATLAAWKAGTAKALTVYIVGSMIEGSLPYFTRFTIPAMRYTGNAVQRQENDLPLQELAFEVVYDGTNTPWKIEYQTTDTTP